MITKDYLTRVVKRIWGPGDDYLVVDLRGVQVFEDLGWKAGDYVKVFVSIEKVNYEDA